jgi:hypothetical protein
MCVEAHDLAPADALGSDHRGHWKNLDENRLQGAGIN